MGMSTHVIGIKAPDEKWLAMKAVRDACVTAGVSVPAEVDVFFGGEAPDPGGVEVRIERTAACRQWSGEGSSGFEVVIASLPPDVTVVRFFNSW